MLWWVLSMGAAIADPPAPTEIEVVRDVPQQGMFKLSFAGREGDTLKVDGWPFGTLPVETELVEGLHDFRIDGTAGIVKIEAILAVEAGKVVEVDLASLQGPARDAMKGATVQGNHPRDGTPPAPTPPTPEEVEATPPAPE